ncbi:MAG: glycosyltransferase [Deltaproteobacteria bacterium]|nr:glycosyltransferase [Deltaproteobacteria bacterium]
MKIAMLSPIAWRTPPRHYGPWEYVVSNLTEELVKRGFDVTLFATGDSITNAKLVSVAKMGYEEDKGIIPKVYESLHISEVFERAEEFELIHNHFDFLPLTYAKMTKTPVLTTIHGFSSPGILPVYKKYNKTVYYVAISEADKNPELDYIATIYHGIDVKKFRFYSHHGNYLLFFGRIHHDKGTYEAIQIAKEAGMRLVIAGIIQDQKYFDTMCAPYIDGQKIIYIGSVGPEKKSEILGEAYALIHPINFDEPFGLSVIEAMACGTPVLAIKRGSMPELVRHGETGFLASNIQELLEKIKDVRKLDRHRCRQWVEEKFTVERMVEEYIQVYKKIIDERKTEDKRPWGFYEILVDSDQHKVKRITVYPEQRLSYQRHKKRSEHWFILHGLARVTKDGHDYFLSNGDHIDIPCGAWHRIKNEGKEPLVFIEIQTGQYFGEDDIERIEDDYGRV